jgi:hypothetical protein
MGPLMQAKHVMPGLIMAQQHAAARLIAHILRQDQAVTTVCSVPQGKPVTVPGPAAAAIPWTAATALAVQLIFVMKQTAYAQTRRTTAFAMMIYSAMVQRHVIR